MSPQTSNFSEIEILLMVFICVFRAYMRACAHLHICGLVRRSNQRKLSLSIDVLSRVNTKRLRSTTKIRDRLRRWTFIHSSSTLVLISIGQLWREQLKKKRGLSHTRLRVDRMLWNHCFATIPFVRLVNLWYNLNRVSIYHAWVAKIILKYIVK